MLQSHVRHSSLVNHVLLAVVLATSLAAGLLGIDFGNHWDEGPILRGVYRAIDSGRWLPDWYNYPSMTHNLVLLAVVPEAPLARRISRDTSSTTFRGELALRSRATVVKIRARSMFLVLTLLTGLWVYLFVLKTRSRSWEALLAAALIAGSWEIGYHARWIAPDGMTMQFAALTLAAMAMSVRRERLVTGWLVVAAVTAGLACGTKYTGGIWLLPVLSIAVARGGAGARGRVIRAAVVLGLFALTVVVITPGILADTQEFLSDVRFEIRHYGSQHAGYSVGRGGEHAWLAAQYLVLAAPSRFLPVSVLVVLMACLGAVDVVRRDRRWIAALVVVPILYFIYMCMQNVMLVRNLLMLLPGMMILAARGTSLLMARFRFQGFQVACAALCAVIVIVNLTWLVYAAQTVRGRADIKAANAVSRYLASHPDDKIFLSALAYDAVQEYATELKANITFRRDEAVRFLVSMCDGFDREHWRANRYGQWHQLTGPYDVNLDYYPTWGGDCRIIDVKPDTAARLGSIRGQR